MLKVLGILSILLVSLSIHAQEFTIETLPVQNGGRLKPFDTYAREALLLTYGRSSYEAGHISKAAKIAGRKKIPAVQIVSTWMMLPEIWEDQKFIRIDNLALKKALNLSEEEKFYSPRELMRNSRLNPMLSELATKRQSRAKFNPFDQAAQRLESQLMVFHEIKMGGIRLVPPAPGSESTHWTSLAELSDSQKEAFFKVLKEYSSIFTSDSDTWTEPFQQALKDFTAMASSVNPGEYPTAKRMQIEVHYNQLAPFMWAWILYALGSILIFLAILFKKKMFSRLAWVSITAAFLLHTYGFALRVYLTERPPVSNMYETVVWVAWGVIFFAAILSFVKKNKHLLIMLGGALAATLAMVVADRAPLILDASLQPLEPVLRSNLWLIVHVMTINLSYAAFLLASGIANVGLFYIIRGHKAETPEMREFVDSCYKSLQVGVVLLAAGTILGGVWADYSWGRFWGWDPKETWALISLLGYLALLHGRLAGLVKNFGMLAGCIIAFNLIIMAWYGVNYVLGAGKHTYGFGAGGIEYVFAYVAIQLFYVGYAAARLKLK